MRVVLKSLEQVGDALVFLVARDRDGRPLDRTLPFPVPPAPAMGGFPATFAPGCDAIDTVDLQVVQ